MTVSVSVVAACAHVFQVVTGVLGLSAVLAMLMDLLIHVPFSVVDALLTVVRHGSHAAEEQEC